MCVQFKLNLNVIETVAAKIAINFRRYFILPHPV